MDWSSRFVDTVTLQSQTGSNTAGDQVFGSQRTIACKVAPSAREVVGANGSVVQATHQVLTDQPILLNDRCWLPGANTTDLRQSRRVLQVTNESTVDDSYRLWKADLT